MVNFNNGKSSNGVPLEIVSSDEIPLGLRGRPGEIKMDSNATIKVSLPHFPGSFHLLKLR